MRNNSLLSFQAYTVEQIAVKSEDESLYWESIGFMDEELNENLYLYLSVKAFNMLTAEWLSTSTHKKWPNSSVI